MLASPPGLSACGHSSYGECQDDFLKDGFLWLKASNMHACDGTLLGGCGVACGSGCG